MKISHKLLSGMFVLFLVSSCTKTSELKPEENPSTIQTNSFSISRSEAEQLANMENVGPSTSARKTETKPKVVKEIEEFTGRDNKVIFFVINYENEQGYLILSADRRLKPTLAFAEKGSFDLNTSNPGIQLWKDFVVENFTGVQKDEKANIDVINLWKQFETGSFKGARLSSEPVWTPEYSCEWWSNHPVPPSVTVSHLTDNVAFWRQGQGYNTFCPSGITTPNCSSSDFECGNAPTGCGPVAVSQVLKYHLKPVTVNGNTYSAATLGAMPRTVPWNCSNTETNQTNVAHLLRDTGKEMDAVYNTIVPGLGIPLSGSGCQTWSLPGKVDNFFSNHGFTSFSQDYFGPGQSFVAELLAFRPLIIFGSNCTTCLSNQHIWVMDGVKDLYNIFQDVQGFCYEQHDVMYQMNWGWQNTSENNGWFTYGGITGSGTLYNSSNMKAYFVRP